MASTRRGGKRARAIKAVKAPSVAAMSKFGLRPLVGNLWCELPTYDCPWQTWEFCPWASTILITLCPMPSIRWPHTPGPLVPVGQKVPPTQPFPPVGADFGPLAYRAVRAQLRPAKKKKKSRSRKR